MTANKILNIGRAGFKVSWALVVFIVTAVFVIIVGFFKLWAVLDDGKETETSSSVGETSWDIEHPFASSYEKKAAKINGEWW